MKAPMKTLTIQYYFPKNRTVKHYFLFGWCIYKLTLKK